MGLTKSSFYKKPKVEIVTSWDDGSIFDLKVVDLLKKYKLSGTFYVVLDWIDKPGYLTWDEIKKIDAEGFKIGAHTLSHPQDLKKLHDDVLFAEIDISKNLIENVLGHSVESFCYPRGRADERVKQMVAEAGFIEARGTGKPGIIKVEDTLYKPGTIHIFNRSEYEGKGIFEFAKEVLDKVVKEGGYCNIWGHSAEVDKNDLWGTLEKVLEYAGNKIKNV